MSATKERITDQLSQSADDLRLCQRRAWPVWLTPNEAADMLRLNIGTVYALVRQGELPAVKVGRTIRIDRDGLFYRVRKLKEVPHE